MAPRIPESFDAFAARLERALESGDTEVRFGQYHHSHAVCAEDGVMRVRRLECSDEEAAAYLREHGIFMPEHAEEISRPRSLVYEARSLDALLLWLANRWPL